MPLSRDQIRRAEQVTVYWTPADGSKTQIWPATQALPGPLAPTVWGIAPQLLASEDGQTPSPKDSFAVLQDLLHRLRQAKIAFELAEFAVQGETYAGVLMKGTSRTRAVAMGYKLREWVVFGLHGPVRSVVYTGHNSRSRSS